MEDNGGERSLIGGHSFYLTRGSRKNLSNPNPNSNQLKIGGLELDSGGLNTLLKTLFVKRATFREVFEQTFWIVDSMVAVDQYSRFPV